QLHSFPTRRSSDLQLMDDAVADGLTRDRRNGVRRCLALLGSAAGEREVLNVREIELPEDRQGVDHRPVLVAQVTEPIQEDRHLTAGNGLPGTVLAAAAPGRDASVHERADAVLVE